MNLKLGEDEIISMSHSLFSEGLDGVEGGGGVLIGVYQISSLLTSKEGLMLSM